MPNLEQLHLSVLISGEKTLEIKYSQLYAFTKKIHIQHSIQLWISMIKLQ